jgi:hypothetical protein
MYACMYGYIYPYPWLPTLVFLHHLSSTVISPLISPFYPTSTSTSIVIVAPPKTSLFHLSSVINDSKTEGKASVLYILHAMKDSYDKILF